jgi:hypothetical protein
LTEKEIGGSGQKGHVAWVASGLKIQEIQYDFPADFPARFLIVIAQTTKVIPSSTGEEDRVPSNARPTKGYYLKACTAPR